MRHSTARSVGWQSRPLALAGAVRVGAVLAGAALLFSACSDDGVPPAASSDANVTEESAPAASLAAPRPYALGFSAVPAALTEESYVRLFDAAAALGDLMLIQRAVPWPELAPNATLAPATEATIARERALLDERGLELLFAIDLWDANNGSRLAEEPPGTSFADPAVAQAYLDYVDLILERYQPHWFALAIDVDRMARQRPDEVDPFETVYVQAYERIRERSPETVVFLTFQLEDLQGLLPWGAPHDPQWGLLLRFFPYLDLLAVSTFPSFLFPFVADIPACYLSRLTAFQKPLALVPVGYASKAGRDGVTFGTPAGQRRFVEWLLAQAEAGQWALVVWLALQDPRFITPAPYDLVSRMGLIDPAGVAKPALEIWREQAQRPWAARPPASLGPPAESSG